MLFPVPPALLRELFAELLALRLPAWISRFDFFVVNWFVRAGGAWGQQAELTADDGASGDPFGFPRGLDGGTAVVGAPFLAVNSRAAQGAGYVEELGTATATVNVNVVDQSAQFLTRSKTRLNDDGTISPIP
jgi:hypothetical protein